MLQRIELPQSLLFTRNYVNGRFVETQSLFDNISPITGEKIATVYEADQALVNEAVQAARQALPIWSGLSVEQRADYLYRVADIIESRFDEFIAAEIADTGRSIQQARTLDVYRGMHNLRTFADIAKHSYTHTDSYETTLADGSKLLNYTKRRPVGVVVSISPWNLPLLSMTWKAAPALMCGNVLLCKPSEETPSSATLLAEAFAEAGVPDGVFNVLHGFGQNSTGEFLTQHPDIDCVTFTGESNTGSVIMRAVSPEVKPVSFELGGKNAGIVFEDADFDEAVQGILRSSFTNSGQVCLCTERVYVHSSIFDRFVQALKEATEKIKIGWPDEDDVFMGPLISKGHREKVLSYFDLALQEGATVVTGGAIPVFNDQRDQGAFLLPTIWTGLADEARCMKEEIFGPVCHLAPFDTEEEVIQRANDTNYGLASAVWTTNLKRAHRVAPQINAGIVWLNHWFARDIRTPFGGNKLSGIGREGGQHSLDFYSELSNICLRLD